jgi:hypothetical protein
MKIFLIFVFISGLFGALPPWSREEKDRKIMQSFVDSHLDIKNSNYKIDTKNYIIYFGKNCKVYFKRETVFRPTGWVGPASKLIYDRSSCDLKEK